MLAINIMYRRRLFLPVRSKCLLNQIYLKTSTLHLIPLVRDVDPVFFHVRNYFLPQLYFRSYQLRPDLLVYLLGRLRWADLKESENK